MTLRRSYAAYKSEALQPSIQGAAAQSQRLGGLADVAIVTGERLLDQETFDLFEAHVLDSGDGILRRAQSEIARAHELVLCHQHGALDGMIELAHIARPRVIEQQSASRPARSR